MDDKLRCPKCSSTQTRFRLRSKEHVCYICGNIWAIEEEEKDGSD